MGLLADLLVGLMPEGPPRYPDGDLTDSPEEVIATLVPTSALVSVDLPALGRPTNDANPLRYDPSAAAGGPDGAGVSGTRRFSHPPTDPPTSPPAQPSARGQLCRDTPPTRLN